jgi:hypothetical protein
MDWILSEKTLSLPEAEWQKFLQGKKPETIRRYQTERNRFLKQQARHEFEEEPEPIEEKEPLTNYEVLNYHAEKKTKIQYRRRIKCEVGRMYYPFEFHEMISLINTQFKIMWSKFIPLNFIVLKIGFEYFIDKEMHKGGVMTPIYRGVDESFNLALSSVLNRMAKFIMAFNQSVTISSIYLLTLEIDSFGGWEAKPKQ